MRQFIFPSELTCLLLCFLIFLGACQSSDEKQSENSRQGGTNRSQYQTKAHIPCFVYDRFGKDKNPSTNIAIDSFKAHLKYLKQDDFTVLTMGEAIHKIKTDQNILDKAVGLTVDDGYKTFKTGSMPLLKKFGYSATLFVNTETVGGSNYLTRDQLQELEKKGIEIGNHSHSHAHFVNREGQEGKEFFISDVSIAQAMFKKKLGAKPSLFAYPYGEYIPSMQSALKQMDFKAATALKSGVLNATSDMFAIPRFPIAANFAELKRFGEKANMTGMPVGNENSETTIVDKNKALKGCFEICG